MRYVIHNQYFLHLYDSHFVDPKGDTTTPKPVPGTGHTSQTTIVQTQFRIPTWIINLLIVSMVALVFTIAMLVIYYRRYKHTSRVLALFSKEQAAPNDRYEISKLNPPNNEKRTSPTYQMYPETPDVSHRV